MTIHGVTIETDLITRGIQLAVAPVFLLTAVAAMIAAVATRLARIVDRGRQLVADGAISAFAAVEITQLRRRGKLANSCIALLTACGFLIGLTIILLFLLETGTYDEKRWTVGAFLSGVVCFLLALACFFAETLVAAKILDFAPAGDGRQR